jgi:hypothetical protein
MLPMASTSTTVPSAMIVPAVITVLVAVMIVAMVRGRVNVSLTIDADGIHVRLPGSHIPGVITAGAYGTGDNRTFWDVRRDDPVLVITCTESSPYRQIVLEVDDARVTAARLRNRLMAR